MDRFVIIEKRAGESPLSALERYRATMPELREIPMTYAGRLDPMACGALMILIGETCKKRDVFTAVDKTYDFEVLYGVETDTLDILGCVRMGSPVHVSPADDIRAGSFRAPYPAFSSKTVVGKPLFRHALDGTLGSISIPVTDMAVRETAFLGIRTVSRDELISEVDARIALVEDGPVNDFRKDAVRASWREIQDGIYTIARFRARVQSGTYIRTLAARAGHAHGIGALAYSIKREGYELPPSSV